MLRTIHWVLLAQRIRLRSLSLPCLQGHRARRDRRHHLSSPAGLLSNRGQGSSTHGHLHTPFLPLLPRTAPRAQLPTGVLLFQGPERGSVLWGLSAASPRLLPKAAPREPPDTSGRSTLLGWGVLTATSDPREDLGGLQSLFSCDSHYLKF